MQQVFKNAFLFREPTVLRRRLLPLCCGHVMILLAADSPYMPGHSTSPNLISLAYAVAVCSRTYEEAEIWMKQDDILNEVHKWGKSCRKLDFKVEGEKFQTFLRDFAAFPERWSKHDSPSGCQHPWPLLIATTIMSMVGESRAWNMPVPKAISIWSAYQETQGDDSLKVDWEIEALAKMRADSLAKSKEKT